MDKSIPKILHYCWFGGKPKPKSVIKCIESWKKYCPEYEIIEWNEYNFDIQTIPYTDQAYRLGKWAFVSDVARLHALVNYGGVYLDTDVELVKPFDRVLNNEAFVGFEGSEYIATAVMGCCQDNIIMTEFLESYKNSQFVDTFGKPDMTTNVDRLTKILVTKGLMLNGITQSLDSIKVYPTDYFSPYDYIDGRLKCTDNTIAIHWFSISWLENPSIIKRLSQLYHRLIGKHRR